MHSIDFIMNGTPNKDTKSSFRNSIQCIINLSSGMGTQVPVLAFELSHQIGIAGSFH